MSEIQKIHKMIMMVLLTKLEIKICENILKTTNSTREIWAPNHMKYGYVIIVELPLKVTALTKVDAMKHILLSHSLIPNKV